MHQSAVLFNEAPWELEAAGIRAAACQVEGARWALVEYDPGSRRLDSCNVGHRGYVIAGTITYEFAFGESLTIHAGQGFVLPAGSGHRGRNDTGSRALLFIIDDAEPGVEPAGAHYTSTTSSVSLDGDARSLGIALAWFGQGRRTEVCAGGGEDDVLRHIHSGP